MTAIDLQTRKPVNHLTPEDFTVFPVWEYANDEEGRPGQDETWVRPVGPSLVPDRSYAHVAAAFAAACGKAFAGYVTVSTLQGPPQVCQGTIFHGHEALFISNPGAFGFDESRKRLLAALGLTEAETFPLSFRLRVPVAGRATYSGGVMP